MFKGKTIGIIGAGDLAFAAHLPLFKATGMDMKWIVDISEKNRNTAAKAYGIPLALSPGQLEQATPTDLVLVACPYGARQQYYDFFRQNKAALYLEKPVARSLAEQRSIESLREDYAIAAGFLRRSMGVTKMVKGIIEDEFFGKLRRVRSHFGTATQNSAGSSFAKNVALAGGGQLFESAIHNIDTISYMLNVCESEVLKKNMVHENGFDLHTEALIELKDAGGHAVEFELLVTCFESTDYEIELTFDTAVLSFSLFKEMVPEIKGSRTKQRYQISDALSKCAPTTPYEILYDFWKEFLAGLEQRRANFTNLSATKSTTAIIEQLYQGI